MTGCSASAMYCPTFFDVAFMGSLANGGGAVASFGGAAGGRSYPRGQFWCRAPFPTVRRMAPPDRSVRRGRYGTTRSDGVAMKLSRVCGLRSILVLAGSQPFAIHAAATLAAPVAVESDGQVLEEVFVTARKRSESLQDAPISITAFSAADLESRGVQDLVDVARYTPNVTIQNNPGNGSSTSVAAVYIRGVGQDDFAPTLEPGVGIYVDGVYLARSVGALLD